jgi:hypothetical protein
VPRLLYESYHEEAETDRERERERERTSSSLDCMKITYSQRNATISIPRIRGEIPRDVRRGGKTLGTNAHLSNISLYALLIAAI